MQSTNIDLMDIMGVNSHQNVSDENLSVSSDSLTIVVEVDDILAIFGSTLVFADISKQLGTIDEFYKRIVHPTIAELYNGTEDQARLQNIYKDDNIANFIYDSLDSKAFLWVEGMSANNHITVPNEEVIRLGTSIIELLVTHITTLVNERNGHHPSTDVPHSINIGQRAKASALPSGRDPRLLEITLEYFWVYC